MVISLFNNFIIDHIDPSHQFSKVLVSGFLHAEEIVEELYFCGLCPLVFCHIRN